MDKFNELYSVGQISAICNIPVKTIRYYNDIGLLLPEYVDPQNNYRYYTKKQIIDLNVIKHFRSSGFSLDDIRILIKREDLSLLKKMLEEKLSLTHKKIQELKYLYNKLELDIKYLEIGKDFSEYLLENKPEVSNEYGIELKTIPVTSILFTRYRCESNPGSYVLRYAELNSLMDRHNLFRAGPYMAIYYDDYTQFDYSNADVEVCLPVTGNLTGSTNVRYYGGFLAVTLLHKGPYNTMTESYRKALEWIERNKFQFIGQSTEKYIIDLSSTSFENNYITEIILPVKPDT